MDVARWGIQGATLPTKVWALGGRFLPEGKDQGETPNMQLAVMEFGETLLGLLELLLAGSGQSHAFLK